MTARRRILVSGGGGFVGRHLMRALLAEGSSVTCILKGGASPEGRPTGFDEVEFAEHDGTTAGMAAIVEAARPDAVIHLASLFLSEHVSSDIEPLIASNVLFGTQLLQALAELESHEATFINIGTSWQHFKGADYDPVNLYSATKQAFEDILAFYVNARRLRALTLKLFDTYGPDDPRPKLVHLLRKMAESGETLQMSGGEQLLDLVHVDDVVSAIQAAERGLAEGSVLPGSSFAVSSGQRLTLRQVVDVYQKATGTQVNVQWGARPYREREVMEPWATGASVPGWAPQWGLKEGLRQIGEAR